MSFTGFTKEASDFLWELAFHNERPWFLEHKEQFQRVLKEPFDCLARETRENLAERFPERDFDLYISRIYRDARRLYGRGPYKDHLWFSVWDGISEEREPSFWFELGAADYSYGMSFWAMGAERAEAFRRCIDADPGKVERLARGILGQDTFRLTGEDYKKPKGDKGEILNPWYNKKWIGLRCTHDFGGAVLSADLPKRLAEDFAFLMPYYDFFKQFR